MKRRTRIRWEIGFLRADEIFAHPTLLDRLRCLKASRSPCASARSTSARRIARPSASSRWSGPRYEPLRSLRGRGNGRAAVAWERAAAAMDACTHVHVPRVSEGQCTLLTWTRVDRRSRALCARRRSSTIPTRTARRSLRLTTATGATTSSTTIPTIRAT